MRKLLLAEPTVDWGNVVSSFNAAWRRSLANVRFSAGDPARYEAVLEDLALCRNLLAPVLPSEAGEIVTRLYDGRGTMEDVDRFWGLVSQIPPEPSEDVWQAMIARILSFAIVQSRAVTPISAWCERACRLSSINTPKIVTGRTSTRHSSKGYAQLSPTTGGTCRVIWLRIIDKDTYNST